MPYAHPSIKVAPKAAITFTLVRLSSQVSNIPCRNQIVGLFKVCTNSTAYNTTPPKKGAIGIKTPKNQSISTIQALGFPPQCPQQHNQMSKHASMAQYRSRIAAQGASHTWVLSIVSGIARIGLYLASCFI